MTEPVILNFHLLYQFNQFMMRSGCCLLPNKSNDQLQQHELSTTTNNNNNNDDDNHQHRDAMVESTTCLIYSLEMPASGTISPLSSLMYFMAEHSILVIRHPDFGQQCPKRLLGYTLQQANYWNGNIAPTSTNSTTK